MTKPLIILANDDGINAPGLRALWEAVKDEFSPHVFAPIQEQSCMSQAFTYQGELQVQRIQWYDPMTPSIAVHGTPVDVIKFALSYLKTPPALILSGINPGSNAGGNVSFSGTVGCCIEGARKGIPSIAFSAVDNSNPRFEEYKPFIMPIVKFFLSIEIPVGTIINVSFPPIPATQIKGIRFCSQGQSYWAERHPSQFEFDNHHTFPLAFDHLQCEEHDSSDIYHLQNDYITIVPLKVRDMTHYDFLEKLKEHSASTDLFRNLV